MSISDEDRHVDAFVILECMENRRFYDGTVSKVIICDPNGEWSEQISDCLGKGGDIYCFKFKSFIMFYYFYDYVFRFK